MVRLSKLGVLRERNSACALFAVSIDLCRPTFFEGWEGSHKQWFMRQSLHPAWMDAEDELESGAISTDTGDSAHAVASQLHRRWLSVFN